MWVAVVTNENGPSKRDDGSWACWVGEDRMRVVRTALKWATIWEGKSNCALGPYQVLVGEITQKAVVPINFEFINVALPSEGE
jgi:hypothetical protein